MFSWDYIAYKNNLLNKEWSGKDMEGSGCGQILRFCPGICLERVEKSAKEKSLVSKKHDLVCRFRN
jgi:hypothetical protein